MTKVTVEHNAPKEPENIFFQGNLVVCDSDEDFVLLVTGYTESWFSGVCISKFNNCPFGEYIDGWDKDKFKQFHGKITLES